MLKTNMNKRYAGLLAALLGGGFCGLVQAQSNVTVYGNIDVAINKESNAAAKMDRGYNNWLGFKGKEVLAEGLATTFNVQTRFKPDTGAVERTSTLFQGETTVGLSSEKYGNLRIGRAFTPHWQNIWAFEPWYNGALNGSLAAYQSGSYTSDGVNDAAMGWADYCRISNGVFVESADMSGVRVSLAGQIEKNLLARTRNVGASVNFNRGALATLVTYERNMNKDNIYFVGASYGFGKLTVMGSFAKTNVAGQAAERLGVLAATYAVGTDTIRAGYGHNELSGASKASVGYVHALSKRTNLYADLYQEKIAANSTGTALGINHTF